MRTYSYDVVYSGHSWMGVLTIAVWGIQFIAGLWIYVFSKWPEGTESLKKNVLEIHHFFGYCVYAMGLSACATGFQDMQSTDAAMLAATIMTDDKNTGSKYMPPPSGAVLASVGTCTNQPVKCVNCSFIIDGKKNFEKIYAIMIDSNFHHEIYRLGLFLEK